MEVIEFEFVWLSLKDSRADQQAQKMVKGCKMKWAYTFASVLFVVLLFSCSLEKRAVTFNAKIGEVDGSTYCDMKLFERSNDAYMISGFNNGMRYRGYFLMTDQDSIKVSSGSPEFKRALDDDAAFQTKIRNAISEFERIGATIIDGSYYLDSVHYVKYHCRPNEYVLVFDSKPTDSLLHVRLGKKYYVLEDGLRYFVREKKG